MPLGWNQLEHRPGNGLKCPTDVTPEPFFKAGYKDQVQEVYVMSCTLGSTSGLISDLCQFVSEGEVSVVSDFIGFIGVD